MGPRRRFPARRGGRRRQLVWATTNQTTAAIAAGSYIAVDLLNDFRVIGASVLGATVVRTHVRMQLPFATSGDVWTYGLIIGRTDDVGVSIVGGVNPTTNPELDWFLLNKAYARFSGATADASYMEEVDIRARRKSGEFNQTPLLVIQNGTAASTSLRIFARTLIALP